MSRLIDAEKLKDHCFITITPKDRECALYQQGWNDAIDAIVDNEPTAEPKKGKWEEIEVIPEAYDIKGVRTWASKMKCNKCDFITFAIEGRFLQYNFCPRCGADMRGE